MKRFFLWLLATLFGLFGSVTAHQVETVEFEFQQLKGVWRLQGQMDIAYMLPEVRWVQDAGPLDRREVMKAPPEELARIRKETENTLRKYLTMSHGGKPILWRIEFPDFKKDPFELPADFGNFALITVNLLVDEQKTPGEFKVHWSSKERATLIILDELSNGGIPVAVEPGDTLGLLKVTRKASANTNANTDTSADASDSREVVTERIDNNAAVSWLKKGFRHVVPEGLDHMLFIIGLFLAVLAFKPMLWQSLLFTLAHSITLTICALAKFQPWTWVETFIALSIVYIGVENLMKVKVTKRRYIAVFIFGLIHGMGFASMFLAQVKGLPKDKLLEPLLYFNLGVELAQIAVIVVAALLFALIKKKKAKERAQMIGSILVTVAGVIWVIQRVFGVDLTMGLL